MSLQIAPFIFSKSRRRESIWTSTMAYVYSRVKRTLPILWIFSYSPQKIFCRPWKEFSPPKSKFCPNIEYSKLILIFIFENLNFSRFSRHIVRLVCRVVTISVLMQRTRLVGPFKYSTVLSVFLKSIETFPEAFTKNGLAKNNKLKISLKYSSQKSVFWKLRLFSKTCRNVSVEFMNMSHVIKVNLSFARFLHQ